MPPRITPITAVHVYRDEPRLRAISLLATSSITIMQKLEINTVALGIKIDIKLLDLFIVYFPYFIGKHSKFSCF
jgi:hypothetical protein